VEIPGDIVAAASKVCASYEYTGRDNCFAVQKAENGDVVVATAASAYNPAYYLVAGTIARPFHGVAVDYVMRAVTALACALLLAWAAVIVAAWGRTRWPLVAFTLGLTPVLVYSSAIASPNGIAYSAAALLWAAMLSLVRREADTARFALPATVGATALVAMHPTGPMFAFLILALAVTLRPVREWWALVARDRWVWLGAAAAILAVTLACTAWIAYAHPAALGEPTDPPLTALDYVRLQLLWALEAVAVFPTVTEFPPTVVYALWGVPLVAMLGFVAGRARRRVGFMLVTTLVLLVAIPSVFTAITYADEGISWQGRYSLPLWLGVSGIAALIAARWTREPRPALVPVVFAMLATAVTVSTVAVGHHEIDHGPADPAAAHVPGGLLLVGVLAAVGVLVPFMGLGRERTQDRRSDGQGPSTSEFGTSARRSESEPSGASST
jgi:hypothetical protein